MPGKLRRGHGKQAARGKKRRAVVTGGSLSPVASKEDRHDIPPVPAAVVRPASREVPAGMRSPDILMELRRIGILAGIILVILVVLALVLP